MTDQTILEFEYLSEKQKLSANKIRNLGDIPGVVYGAGEDTRKISLQAKDLRKALELPSIFSQIIVLQQNEESHKVILKEVQINPSNDKPVHVDFMRVSSKTKITMQVPIKFINEDACFGVKNEGGMISKNKNDIELTCLAENLPEFIEVDVAELKLGNSIMQTGLALPEGVDLSNTLLTGQDQPIVSCSTTRASLEIEEDVEGEISEAALGEEDPKEDSSDADKDTEEENS
ncbi:MAG: 50S ribosomal protein L25 [Gammaproteobacteria bacterium]|nr:MAG: 50S ribosomal protein L25 [Gammaproteobacteria bacterium]